jgi:hypothetical protein
MAIIHALIALSSFAVVGHKKGTYKIIKTN